VEHAVLGVAIALGGEQARPVGAGNAALDQEDVGLLAGLEHTQLGVDRGQLGDEPVGVRAGPALERSGLVPGGPAGPLVGCVVDGLQLPRTGPLGEGLVVVETTLVGTYW
jgi:hypothetical protein